MLCVKFGPNSIGSGEEDENVDRQTYRLRDDEQQSIRNAWDVSSGELKTESKNM